MIPSQAAPVEPSPTAGLSAPGHSPGRFWWWDGSAWHSAVSPDGSWWWDGAAWTPRPPTRSTTPPRVWLRRLSLIGSFGALVVALVYALSNMSDIYRNGNIPSGLLLGALIASLLLWLGAIALGWQWRKSLYLLIWVLTPVWLGANYFTIVGACSTCQWGQGAQVAQMQLGQFNYVGWRVEANAQFLTVADGRVWMPDVDGSEMWVYSASTGQAYVGDWSGLVQLGNNPVSIASYGGRLWLVSPTTGVLYEVNPKLPLFKAVEARFHLGGQPLIVAAGRDALWIADPSTAEVIRFDPAAGRVVANVQVGKGPSYVLVANDGAVWVTNYSDDTLSRIDPSTNQVVETIAVGRGPGYLLEASGSIWCSNETGRTVSRLDLATRTVTAVEVGDAPLGLAEADGYIWVANLKSQDLSLIDPSSSEVVSTLRVGAHPWSFAVDGSTLWLATYSDGVLGRITPPQ